MDQLELVCINHPKQTTRLRCASCDSPICLKCMRQSSVGTKCPDCARVPLRAKSLGRPRHYIAGGLAGLVTAGVLGAALTFMRGGFFGLLMPLFVGFLTGSVVVRAASNQHHRGIQVTAAVSTAAGMAAALLLLGLPVNRLVQGQFVVSILIAALFAGFWAGRS